MDARSPDWDAENVDYLMAQADEAAALESGSGVWDRNKAAPAPDDAWNECWADAVRRRPELGGSSSSDEHACPGPMQCEHIVLNKDRIWVCELSGICWGGEHVEDLFDNQMNRRSTNPDEISGCVSFFGYRSKRDAAALSEVATLAACDFKNVETTQYEAPQSPQREAPKRGARCVGEADQPRAKRRKRTCKRDVEDASGTRALVEDAVVCINSKFCRDSNSPPHALTESLLPTRTCPSQS